MFTGKEDIIKIQKKPDGFIREFENDEAAGVLKRRPQRIKKETGSMKRENDLGRDDVGALVWRTALPSMLAQFVSVLYSIVDRMYIGHIAGAGETALAGVGVCGPVVTMVGSAAVWISWGASPLMGIRMGEGRPEEAKRILRTGFVMLLRFRWR